MASFDVSLEVSFFGVPLIVAAFEVSVFFTGEAVAVVFFGGSFEESLFAITLSVDFF